MSDISYSWNFNPLEVTYNQDQLQDVVTAVHWQYYATYPLPTGSLVKTAIGVASFSGVDSGSFVPYADLTQDIVTAWVTGSLGEERVTQMQTNLSQSVATELYPTSGPMSPPWVVPPTV